MKKISFIIFLSCLVYFTGCTKKDEKTETTNKPTNPQTNTTPVPTQTEKKEEPTKTVEEKKETVKTETNNKASLIKLNSTTGAIDTTLTGIIDGSEKKIIYEFEAKKDQYLFFRIKVADPEKNPDVRLYIPELISPSGKVDGPFGVKVLRPYPLSESGIWKVSIAENITEGKPWKGEYNFILNVR